MVNALILWPDGGQSNESISKDEVPKIGETWRGYKVEMVTGARNYDISIKLEHGNKEEEPDGN